MSIFIRQWGNSAAVHMPASARAAAGMAIDDPVEVHEENGRIVITPAKPQAVTLKWLLEGITPETLHPESDWGPARGREFW